MDKINAQTSPLNFEAACEHLAKSMRSTSASRFNASRRLERHDRRLTFLVAFSTCYIIILTILPYFITIAAAKTDIINFYTVCLSILILVASLLQYSSNNGLLVELHHRSGMEIEKVHRDFIGSEANLKTYVEYNEKYSRALEKYSINHNQMDYDKYVVNNKEKHPWIGCLYVFKVYLKNYITGFVPDMLLVTVTLITLCIVAWSCLDMQILLDNVRTQ